MIERQVALNIAVGRVLQETYFTVSLTQTFQNAFAHCLVLAAFRASGPKVEKIEIVPQCLPGRAEKTFEEGTVFGILERCVHLRPRRCHTNTNVAAARGVRSLAESRRISIASA